MPCLTKYLPLITLLIFGALRLPAQQTPLFKQQPGLRTLKQLPPSAITAAFDNGNGKAYMFAGDRYIRYDIRKSRADEGYPKSTGKHWRGLEWDQIDAAFKDYGNEKVYLFRGNEFVRYDQKTKSVEAGYPKRIAHVFRGIPDSPEAAVVRGSDLVLFFKAGRVYTFSRGRGKVLATESYPTYFKNNAITKVDAALRFVSSNKKNYFFTGEKYWRADNEGVDTGYPKNILEHWINLKFTPTVKRIDLSSTVDKEQRIPFNFTRSRPKVTMLIHGITVSEKTTDTGREERVNTAAHPQFYWGHAFLRLLMGVEPGAGELQLVRMRALNQRTQQGFSKREWDDHKRAVQRWTDPEPRAVVIAHRDAGQELMINYRDGSETFMKQLGATIDQLYRTYQAHYGEKPAAQQPQIYLVAHSFGGIVARGILSNPSGPDRSGDRLTDQQRERADFLRDRVVSLTTLATPHEGSPLPGMSRQISDAMNNLASLMPHPDQRTALRVAAREKVSGRRPVIQDIKHNDFYLKGLLRPERAKRTNGELVPIYTLSGSNPAHTLFLSKRPYTSFVGNSVLDMLGHYSSSGYNKVFEETHLLVLVDLMGPLITTGNKPLWNKVPPQMKYGDRFTTPDYGARLVVKSGGKKVFTAQTADPLIQAMLYTGIGIYDGRDGYYDSDGFVSFDSGHGLTLGTGQMDYFNESARGSWYRIYGANYGSAYPWDYDNHRSICFNPGTAAFVHNYIYGKGGPYARPGAWSSWSKSGDRHLMPAKSVWIEITHIKDTDGDIDQFPHGDADFFTEVKIGDGPWQKSSTYKDVKSLYGKHFQKGKNYVWHFGNRDIRQSTIVPVIIRVTEADSDTPDDICSASAKPFLEEVVIYVDTQNGKVYGEVEGNITKDIFYTKGSSRSTNNIDLGFRIRLE